MNVLNDAYTLADTLYTTVVIGPGGSLRGDGKQRAILNGHRFEFPTQIVSSIATDNGTGVLVTSVGDLCFLVLVGFDRTIRATVLVLDARNLDKPPTDLIESEGCQTLNDVVQLVRSATVKVYHQSGSKKWREAKVPA